MFKKKKKLLFTENLDICSSFLWRLLERSWKKLIYVSFESDLFNESIDSVHKTILNETGPVLVYLIDSDLVTGKKVYKWTHFGVFLTQSYHAKDILNNIYDTFMVIESFSSSSL